MIRSSHLLIILCCITLPHRSDATEHTSADERDFLHVVLVGDTADPTIGGSVSHDLEMLTYLLSNLPPTKCSVKVLSGDEASPSTVVDSINQLEVRPNDALLVYYSGHGVYTEGQGHVLTMGNGDLTRDELRKTVLAKKPALSVIITDSCSVYYPEALRAGAPLLNVAFLRYLFYRQKGVVDVSSSAEGEVAYCTESGGLFTKELINMFYRSNDDLDSNQDGVPSWGEVLAYLQQALTPTNKGGVPYSEHIRKDLLTKGFQVLGEPPQLEVPVQHPSAVRSLPQSFPVKLEKQVNALGFTASTSSDGKLRVTRVYSGSFAEWIGVSVGDEILEGYEHQRLETMAELNSHVQASRESTRGLVPFGFRQNPTEEIRRRIVVVQD